MILIEDYADKVERFIDLWREQMITDIELVENVTNLGKEVLVIEGNYIAHPSIVIRKRQE